MATVAGSPWWQGTDNPFPPAAVARISDLRPDIPTIRTAAIRKIDKLVADYLRATQVTEGMENPKSGDLLANEGKVIVIQGDYGTGKTHLAIEILDRIAVARTNTRAVYHVAPGGTFLTLYLDLIGKVITAEEVKDRVQEFYADIVAASLRERPFADRLAGLLEQGDADPQVVVERSGLREGDLRQELRQRLSAVTGDEAFSKALAMLLQPAQRDAAWRWLSGSVPEQLLVEQGITKQILTDESALEALGVIALLYGRKNRRFVLIIDEMEKIVLTWDRSTNASTQAFKKLLEVFKGAGALLVSCGLPDMFELLPKDPGRIDEFIRPSILTEADVGWYIEETQGRISGRRTLEPFTSDSITYLVHLSGGIAREAIRLCYQSYQFASATGQEITPTVIRAVAHDLSPSGGTEMVRTEIARILLDQGRKATRNWVLSETASAVVDFWVAVGESGAGCAIVVADAIMEERHVDQLTKQLSTIRSQTPHREVILVVSGYLAAQFTQPLAEAFGGESLVIYNTRSFQDDFTQAVTTALGRISPELTEESAELSGAPEFRALREETERIGRQQTNTLRLVQQLTSRVLAVGIASDERLDGIQRALEAVSGPPGSQASRPETLPTALEEIFGAAQLSLTAYGDIRKLIAETFESAAQEPGSRFSLTYRLRGTEVFGPIGVSAFLTDLLMTFRESVQTWLGSLDPGGEENPAPLERERLRSICRTFDALYGITPLFQLDPLPDLTGVADDQQGLLSRAGRTARREALQDAFDGLGDRVYQATIELAGGAIDLPHRLAN
jgi:hypothetical protein